MQICNRPSDSFYGLVAVEEDRSWSDNQSTALCRVPQEIDGRIN